MSGGVAAVGQVACDLGFRPMTRHLFVLAVRQHELCPCCLPPLRSFNVVNGEHQAIAKELDKAQAEFKEFERKDIKFRWARGVLLRWGSSV